MKITLTGYFKFSPVRTERAEIPYLSVAETLLKHAAGSSEGLTKNSSRDAWNALAGRCGELGWYRNGGWTPHGSSSFRCRAKDMGDILGVCATFGPVVCPGVQYPRAWLYCDRDFEAALTECFFPPDDRLRFAVGRGITGAIVDIKDLPDGKWLADFCAKTHDPVAFSVRMFGRRITRQEALAAAERLPKMAKYIRTMLVGSEDKED